MPDAISDVTSRDTLISEQYFQCLGLGLAGQCLGLGLGFIITVFVLQFKTETVGFFPLLVIMFSVVDVFQIKWL